ncbi:MAG: hypothetical protein QUS33_05565 [Dehalococcoidia bacterium]|nr:hypothetical protein [Dehalococcoidia bacterium]
MKTTYYCPLCDHYWQSSGRREVMRCSKCHRRKGIPVEKAPQARDAARVAPNYYCTRCGHTWHSKGTQHWMCCSKCHHRTGLPIEWRQPVDEAVNAVGRIIEEIGKSPPPRHPPPVRKVAKNLRRAVSPVLRSVASEFPDPRPPADVALVILRRATSDLKKKRKNVTPPT